MRRGGSKQKGSAFERQICKELSLWVSSGKDQDIFWRSAMSGGRSTVALKKGTKLSSQAGDISSIHKRGHTFIDKFFVECKFYKNLEFAGLINGRGKLLDFWYRACSDAEEYNKLPFLIAKQNHYPTVVCLDSEGINLTRSNKHIVVTQNQFDIHMIYWNTFLSLKPKILLRKRRIKL